MYTNIYKYIINSTHCYNKNISACICALETTTAIGNQAKLKFPNQKRELCEMINADCRNYDTVKNKYSNCEK